MPSARYLALLSLPLAALACAAGAAAAQAANPDPELIARWEPCQPNTGVTVIVDDRDIGEKKLYVGCAPGEQTDGLEALKNAGFTPAGTTRYGLEFICRIDGEPTVAEQSCEQTPPESAFWSYWHGKPKGTWEYSKDGAKSSKTRAPVNTVEGWSFGDGEPPRIEPQQEEGQSEGSHEPASSGQPGGSQEHAATPSGGVLGAQEAGAPRVQALRLDGEGAGQGLVGVSWQAPEAGVGVSSWTIAAAPVGSPGGWVNRATGAGDLTSALVKLPPGSAYELQITFTDVLGHGTTMGIGRALVPYDARWRGLRYRGRWQRRTEPGAWTDTVARGGAGAEVSARLPAGRPVFALGATAGDARVEVLAGNRRQVFALARGAGGLREITAAARAGSGTVSLRVLDGTVDLDGVAVEG